MTYGLIGKTLGHSFSRQFFTDKFSQEGIDGEYLNFELPEIDVFPTLFDGRDIRGLNVTIPYKQAIIPFLNDLSDEAREIGAVNVIKIKESKGVKETKKVERTKGIEGLHLTGYNTDVIGFRDSIRPLLRPHHTKALVLGTGGASRAIRFGLRQLGLDIQSVSRTKSKDTITYDELTAEIMRDYTVIVNTTPLGTSPNVDACPDIPYSLLTDRHLLFDLVYNPSETLFLRQGREHGAQTKNGLEMLHLQAIAAWEIWNS